MKIASVLESDLTSCKITAHPLKQYHVLDKIQCIATAPLNVKSPPWINEDHLFRPLAIVTAPSLVN